MIPQQHIAAVARRVWGRPVPVEHVAHGVSTHVYRARVGDKTYYLRVLPEQGASFVPEAEVHALLRQAGASVPEVVYIDPLDPVLGLSVMVTSEVPGQPIADAPRLPPARLEQIVAAAGRDLARINSVPVAGWGWIERSEPAPGTLSAEHASCRGWALEHWEADLAFLAAVLAPGEPALLERTLARYDRWLDAPAAWLAHGDLDATHIYQQDGRYSGLIDFGEIRGAGRWYDAGHFHVRDGERLPLLLLPALLRGYGELIALPDDIELRVSFDALLINVRALARSLRKRPPDRFNRHQLTVLRADLQALA